ncbi:MAG: hypothetical protein JXR96_25450 [Deltaproteobacteria bacterium]|nr:hypothetical protein [Deltaproteobacteria bacterium]
MRPIALIGGLAALFFLFCGCWPEDGSAGSSLSAYGQIEQAEQICADGSTVLGIDVSHHQGTIDWDRVAADGVKFAFIRVSDSLAREDEQFDRNWPQARSHGIIRGAYQYFRPTYDARDQADLLLDKMGSLQDGDLPPVIDVEVGGDGLVSKVRTWLDRVESATGVKPLIYTGPAFWRGNGSASSDFRAYPLWIANWDTNCPDVPEPWTGWRFWQYSCEGSLGGLSPLDLDRYNGSLSALQAFAYHAECGDGECNGGETAESCPRDCLDCEPIPETGRVLEESDSCFARSGPEGDWHAETSGHEGGCLWTATSSGSAAQSATWILDFEQAGAYELSVYVPAGFGSSRSAVYRIMHAGQESLVTRSQRSVAESWLSLGRFSFDQGGGQWVELRDDTGEDGEQLAFDALQVAPEDGCECQSSDPPESQGCGWCGVQIRTCDGCHWSAWHACTGEGECEPESSDWRACDQGYQQRVCSQDCSWGEWGECAPDAPDGGIDGGDGALEPEAGCSCGVGGAGSIEGLLALGLWLAWRKRGMR